MSGRVPSLPMVLYASHSALELVLGTIKMRGTYSGFAMPEGADKFARHHGVALLALALLGALVMRRGLVRTPTGSLVSTVLAAFHFGCVMVMIHAMSRHGKGAKVAVLHAPFAAGFAWHALTDAEPDATTPPGRKSRRS